MISPPPAGRAAARSAWLPLAAILLAGGLLRVAAAVHHERVDFDEGRYLDNAVHLLEGNGFTTSTVSHFFGDPPRPPRPEDVSSPLYPIFLAGLFSLTGVSFDAARIASLALSLTCPLLTYLLGRRFFGEAAGLIAAAGVALQPEQAFAGVLAMTESLYTLLLLLTILLASPLALPREAPPRAARIAVAGVLCGLLYLIRQNGAAVAAALFALLIAGPLAPGERRARRAGLSALLAGAAFLVCLPWFYRNAVVFGSPAHSAMKHIAWAEHGRSLYTPGEALPSMSAFLEEHGARGLAANLYRRAQRLTDATLSSETGPQRWLTLLAFMAPLVPALRPGAAAVLPPALLSAALLIGVAPWSGALPRYLLPVRPLLYMAGAAVAVWGARRIGFTLRRARNHGNDLVGARLATDVGPGHARTYLSRLVSVQESLASGAVLMAAIAALLWAAAGSVPTVIAYFGSDQRGPDRVAREASAWIAAHTGPSDVIMEGGYLHQYAFLFRRGIVWTPLGDIETLRETARRYGATYLAVTPEVVRFRPDLSAHWAEQGRVLSPLSVPGDLEPVFDRAAGGIILYRFVRAPGA